MLLEVVNQALADHDKANLQTGEVTPFNMAVHPAGQSVVLGLGSAGVQLLHLHAAESGPPALTYAQGELACTRQHLLVLRGL